jgi:hypothetical protein
MTTQRINDPRLSKSRNGIKGNFETWTRLGLFVISTDNNAERENRERCLRHWIRAASQASTRIMLRLAKRKKK